MTLDSMVQKTQQFEDQFGALPMREILDNSRTRGKNRQAYVRDSWNEEAATGVAKIQAKDARQEVWNCGGSGHFSRDCPTEKIGNGFSHRPQWKTKPASHGQT